MENPSDDVKEPAPEDTTNDADDSRAESEADGNKECSDDVKDSQCESSKSSSFEEVTSASCQDQDVGEIVSKEDCCINQNEENQVKYKHNRLEWKD